MLGYAPAEFHETNAAWMKRLHHDDRDSVASVYRDYVAENLPEYRVEYRQRRKSGDWKWILSLGKVVERDATGQPLRMLGTHTDITELKQAEVTLRASLEENVVLLKEVHHRVKNNLQIVSSLLNLQAGKVQNPEVQDLLRDTQGRIRAMAVLHETLYASGSLARVNVRWFAQTIISQVARFFLSDNRDIRVRQDVADVMLPLDQAVPVGLVLNELLSNALKHAFADRASGEITVQLQVAADGHYVLRVADDGVGLPADSGVAATGSIGLLLVEGLVRQLEGELTVSQEAGTTFQIVFPIQPA